MRRQVVASILGCGLVIIGGLSLYGNLTMSNWAHHWGKDPVGMALNTSIATILSGIAVILLGWVNGRNR